MRDSVEVSITRRREEVGFVNFSSQLEEKPAKAVGCRGVLRRLEIVFSLGI